MELVPVKAGGIDRRVGRLPLLLRASSLLAVLAVSGCAPDSAGAGAAAEDFRRAVAGGDTSTACSMLSPQTRQDVAKDSTCEEQLASLELSVDGADLQTERYGRNAMVEFEDDTVFLTVTGSGWQVTGAGCTPRGESPYECEVGG
jgi:hypothetical protein